jgi:hypothetical protein
MTMKYLLPGLIVVLTFFYACKKEEILKLEANVNQAYAFDIGTAWEVNISTKVKGFMEEENNGKFKMSLFYTIDLVTPTGKTITGITSRAEDKIDKEKLPDFILDSQFNLDTTYVPGKYKAIINIRDVITGKTATATGTFDLTKD